jgi:peptidoglycan/LPS O-acetylase OafA/YrhL
MAGLDAVRAIAVVGVVFLHAAVPYLVHPMPGLSWAITDHASTLVDLSFWSIEIFIMPLFLMISGFLLWRSISHQGTWKTLQSRTRRLGVPLLFGVLVILPIDFYLWMLGWIQEARIPWYKARSLKFDAGVDEHLWGLSHLWYLLYVMTYVALIAVAYRLAHSSSRLAILIRHPKAFSLALISLCVVAITTITIRPEVVWGFQHQFTPVPSKWIYCFVFFAAGVLWNQCDPLLDRLSTFVDRRFVSLAMICFVGTLTLGIWHVRTTAAGLPEHALARVMLAALTVLTAVLASLSILGIATCHVRQLHPGIAYLAKASFWIYLVHHPLVVILQIDLRWLGNSWPSEIKFALVTLLAVTVSLGLYEFAVRTTSFGRWTGLGDTLPKPPVTDAGTMKPPLRTDQEPQPVVRRAA